MRMKHQLLLRLQQHSVYAENQTAIPDATITATDVDADDTLTFSVSGDVLEIDANGVLSFATAPDFETTTSVTATVTVTDAAGLTDTQEVTVTVTDENEAPDYYFDYRQHSGC